MQHDTPECPPIIYTWIEPFGVAAHAILIMPGPNNGCFECCLSNDLSYKFSVGLFQRGEGTIQEGGARPLSRPTLQLTPVKHRYWQQEQLLPGRRTRLLRAPVLPGWAIWKF